MRFMKRSKIYQCSNYNCTFSPEKLEAYSYNWWCFVKVVEGKVIFNNYRYSNSTSKHQSKVRSLLTELNIKVDIAMPIPKGINNRSRISDMSENKPRTLSELIIEAEEYLCDKFLTEQLKAQDNYAKRKYKKAVKRLEDYLENDIHFRDYEIRPMSDFGNYNKIAVHQVVDLSDIADDVDNAIYNFHRDAFGNIVFYV